jgi:methionyl-tRNA formyltransferase
MTTKNKDINYVFFGTPDFSVILLDEMEKLGFTPSLVVTAPDKPQGRKMIITPPPVKIWAEARKIPVLQPEKLDANTTENIKEFSPELFVVAAYGKMIPRAILDIPKFGSLNWHPSLLPKQRGPSPMVSSLLSENKTGITIMVIDEEMDHGPIIEQKELVSWENDLNDLPRLSELQEWSAKEGGRMLAEILPKHVRGETTAISQEHEKATYSKKLKKEDGLLDLNDPAEKNLRKIRAFDVWPRAYFFYNSHEKNIRTIVTDAEITEEKLAIKKVLPEGGKEISYEEFLRRFS